MSNLTLEEAYNDVAKMFNDGWTAMTPPSQLTAAPLVVWDDVEPDNKPDDGAVSWARFTMRHGFGTQRTIGGSPGSKVFERTGIVTVQIFTPRGFGLLLGQRLGKICLDIFEPGPSPLGVLFRDISAREVGTPAGDPWFQTNVQMDFEYDERK